MVTGLHTLICETTDMERSVAFYRDVLGLKPGTISPWWSDFDLGGARLGLHPPFREGSVQRGGGWVVGVQVGDIAAFRQALADGGYPTMHEYHETPSGVVLDFADPDGNPLQAIQVGSKRSDFA